MADDEETALRKEIAFLTNLINGGSSVSSNTGRFEHGSLATSRQSRTWSSTTRTQHSIYKAKTDTKSKYAWTQSSHSSAQPSRSSIKPTGTGHQTVHQTSYPTTRTEVGGGAENRSAHLKGYSSRGGAAQAYHPAREQSLSWSSQRKCTRYSLTKEKEKGPNPLASRRVVKLPGAKLESVPPAQVKQHKSVTRTIDNTLKSGSHACQAKAVKSTKGSSQSVTGTSQHKRLLVNQKPGPASTQSTGPPVGPVSTPRSPSHGAPRPAEKGGILSSPTVIRAGKKIIEEIERLNKAVALLDRASQKGSLTHSNESVVQVDIAKPTKRQVLVHSSSAPCLKSLAKGAESKIIEQTQVKRAVTGAGDSTSKKHSAKLQNYPPKRRSSLEGNVRVKSSQSPYKLVRSAQPPGSSTVSHPTPRTPTPSEPNSKRAVDSESTTPRRRVYLTKRKLENSHGPLPPSKMRPSPSDSVSAKVKNPPSTDHTQRPHKRETCAGPAAPGQAVESRDMKRLLRELSIIDTAFRTAKLQSSQKLLKRALATKQKMTQRKAGEKGRVATPVRTYRYGQTKWSNSMGRKLHSRSKSPVKGQKSWKSRFSLKKSVSDADLSINQLLGRDVKNVSSSKYKFINGKSPKSTTKYQGRISRQMNNKHSLKVDRRSPRQKASAANRRGSYPGRGQRLVSIGGLVYNTSRRKLTRTSSTRKVFARKGLHKLQARTVTVQGQKYRATKNGLSLRREDSVPNGKDDVRRLSLSGVQYVQTRPGTLVRADHTASRTTASRFIYRSIAMAAAATRNRRVSKAGRSYCMFYNRFGKCNRGDKCPYIHDPEKVAVCTRFLRGTCGVTDCPFSHQMAPEKMAVCTRYLRGVCVRDECPYRHVNVGHHAQPCQDFLKGYCPRGNKCKKKHSRVCPDHNGQGSCEKGASCRLHHPTRRGEKRPVDPERTPSTNPKLRQKIARLSSVSEADPGGDDPDLPLAKRHLPAYIALYSEEDELMPPPTPGDEPLQIRPNLSFDAS